MKAIAIFSASILLCMPGLAHAQSQSSSSSSNPELWAVGEQFCGQMDDCHYLAQAVNEFIAINGKIDDLKTPFYTGCMGNDLLESPMACDAGIAIYDRLRSETKSSKIKTFCNDIIYRMRTQSAKLAKAKAF